ncbi:MAG: ORF6N domain-containing protein [Rikenellaceae bacterium]
MDITTIQNRIFEIRGQRVMLDFHLAELYEVQTKALKQAVKRNERRFPTDFRFTLTREEFEQLVTICDQLPTTLKHSSVLPDCFTEQGVAMLSSVLRSDRAIDVNISIIRAFVDMRRMVAGYKELAERIEQLEISTDAQFNELYQALTELMSKPEVEETPRRRIGY